MKAGASVSELHATAVVLASDARATAVIVAADGASTQLSLWGTPRPPPPQDPFVYDAEVERREYCRALLPAAEITSIEEEIKKNGFKTIEWVRETIRDNTVKESMDARGETYAIDPEIMMVIDARTNYKVFIVGDNVYTREELYAHLPFHDLKAEPENVFVQQEIGVFPARKYAMDDDEFEYVARDLGDDTIGFVMIEDMVGSVTRKNYKAKRAPVKIVKTKVFLGKEKWEDFCMIHRFAKGVVNISGGKPSPFLAAMIGAAASQARPMLMDEAAMKEQQRRTEENMKRREEEARIREEAAKRREEETRRVEQKIQNDVKRIEAMLATMKKVNSESARATRPYKPAAASIPVSETSGAPPPTTSAREDNVSDVDAFTDDAELRKTLREVEAQSAGNNAAPSTNDDSVPL